MAGAIRISALFLFHSGSNEGYAIASLERLSYEVALEMRDKIPRGATSATELGDKGPL